MMVLADYVLLAAVVVVLISSLVLVVTRRRRELADEHEMARLLSHMATTVKEIHQELETKSPAPNAQVETSGVPDDLDQPEGNRVWRREFRFVSAKPAHASHDRGQHDATDFSLGTGGFLSYYVRNRHEGYVPYTVVNWWEHPAPTAESDSYRSTLGGSRFDDAVIHAAKVGVIDRDQADALIFWAESTTAIHRPAAKHRSALTEGSAPRATGSELSHSA